MRTTAAENQVEEQSVTPVEFGVTLPLSGIAEFARKAEQLGFRYLTSGDHVAFYGPQANAFIALSVAAGATEQIKLLSSVTLVPLYPAALMAKMTAMLDVASNGRFTLGAGIGGEYPAEFDACGVPVNQRGARTDEALQVIDRLLTEENVSFEGRYNRFEGITILPRPLQRPRPPIWIAGRSEPAMRRAARFGDAWMPYMYTPDQLARSRATVGQYLDECGRNQQSVRSALFTFATVYPDGSRARRVAAEVVGATYRQDFTGLVDRYVVAGSPQACARRLQEYVDAGASAIMVDLACPPEDLLTMLQRLAEDVVGDLRGERAGLHTGR